MDKPYIFELTLRRIFGDKKYGCASSFNEDKSFYKLISESIKRIYKDIENESISEKSFERISRTVDTIETISRSKEVDSKFLITELLSLITSLLGFNRIDGTRTHQLHFIQNEYEYYNELSHYGHDWLKTKIKDNELVITRRKELVINLKKEKLSNYIISQILNISPSKVSKILSEEKYSENL